MAPLPIRALIIATAAILTAPASPLQAAYRQADWDDCRSNDFERKIAGCTRMLNSQITKVDRAFALTNRASAYLSHGDYDSAISDTTEAIANYPDYVLANVDRSHAYLAKGDIENAISDATTAIRSTPDYPAAYTARAHAYAAKRDYDGAIADDTKAIALAPGYSGPWNLPHVETVYVERGNNYYAKGDYDRALADYDTALRIEPDNASAMRNRGLAFEKKGDHAAAIDAFGDAIKADPKFAPAYVNRAESYLQTDQYEPAMADYEAAIKLAPDRPASYLGDRAMAYAGHGDFAHAIADYNEVIRLNVNNSAIYFMRGISNLYGTSAAKAMADFDQSLALNPKDAYVQIWREITAQRIHQPSRIADALGKVDMTSWPAPLLRLYAGQLAPDEALSAAGDPHADAETRKGRLCEANFYSGEQALLKGTKDVALTLFKNAVAECPWNFVELAAAKAELRLTGAQ